MFALTRTGETLKSYSLRASTLGGATSALNPKSAFAFTGSARTSTRGARTSIFGVLNEIPASKLLL